MITGGAGFIGTHLARTLAAEGWTVHVIDLRSPVRSPRGVHAHVADVRSALDHLELPTAPDLVVHLAAVHREPGHAPREYFDANVGGTARVLALCDRLGATDLVLASSISVYGAVEGPVGDDQPVAPDTPYGASKVQAEDLCRAWVAADPGRRLSIVRPAAVFGSGEGGNFTRLAGALRGGRFVYPGRPDTVKGCVYVDDLIQAMLAMHGSEREATYNVAFPRPYTLEEICAEMARLPGHRPPRGTVPVGLVRAVGLVGDVLTPLGRATGLSRRRVDKLVTSTDVRPERLVAAGFALEHDLRSALEHWYGQPPVGHLV